MSAVVHCEDGVKIRVERATKGRIMLTVVNGYDSSMSARMVGGHAVALGETLKRLGESLPPLELTDEERKRFAATIDDNLTKLGSCSMSVLGELKKLLLEGRST